MSRIITPILLILIALGVFFSYTKGAYADAQGTVNQIEKYNETLAKAEELQAVHDDLIKKKNSFKQEDLEQLEKLLPKKVDNVRLIIELEAIAKAHGITFDSITVNDASSNTEPVFTDEGDLAPLSVVPSLKTVAVQISFVAEYNKYLNFMADLEKSLRMVDIQAINFNVSEDSDTTYAVAMQTYWLE